MIELGASRAAAGAVADLPGLVPLGVILTTAPYAGIEAAERVRRSEAALRKPSPKLDNNFSPG